MLTRIKKIYTIFSTFLLMSLVLYLTIGTIFIIWEKIDYLQFSTYLSYFGIASIILYLFHKVIDVEGVKLKDVIMIILSIIGFISYKNALDPEMALIGTYGRNEGLKVILSYYCFFLLSSTIPKKNQHIIMSAFLFTGIFQIAIGVIQTLGILNIFGYSRIDNFSTTFNFASGTFGNPNFYSTFILMCLLYVFGNLLKSDKLWMRIIYGLLLPIYALGLIIGNTMSCLIAAAIVIMITLITRVNKKNIKKVTIGLFIIIVAFLLIFKLLDNQLNQRLTRTVKRNLNEINEILQNGIDDSTGNNRIYVWKETLKHVEKNIYDGIGIDNFSLINYGTYICAGEMEKRQCFDKAHNEYLQILITEGVFAFATYIFLILYTLILFIKSKKYKNRNDYALNLAFSGYLLQASLNISVITVAPIFYIVMGSIHSKDEEIDYNKLYQKKAQAILTAIILLFIGKCILTYFLA